MDQDSNGHTLSPDQSMSTDKSEQIGDGYSVLEALERRLAPGSEISDLDAAYVLYCEYGRHLGFSVRKGSQGYFTKTSHIRMKLYHCACEGRPDNKASKDRVAAYKKQQTRTECKARLRISREAVTAKWKVSAFHKAHNHELYEPDQTYLLRSARNLSHAQKSVIDQLAEAGIGISKACRFMETEARGVQNVGFTRKDAYNAQYQKKIKTRLPDEDANALLRYFRDQTRTDVMFYWDFTVDDDNRLTNFFFRDTHSAMDYEVFGDVVTLDTTFKTNKYNLVCTPFVGINHHRNNVMFGMGFLSDETTASFEWLLTTFLKSMNGKEPLTIFTDQCQALMNAVDFCFHSARHRLCQWHVSQNAPAHFGDLNTNSEFKLMWRHCMNGCETETEFDITWRRMIEEHDLQGNTWFETMYRLRSRWSDVFTNDRFSAGMHATSRSEATNRVIKDLCSRRCTLTEFVRHYEQIQSDWRLKERAEDARCLAESGQFVQGNRLMTQAAQLLTRNAYTIFEAEAAKSLNADMIKSPIDYTQEELEFFVSMQASERRNRRVLFHSHTLAATCSCRMWETEGILCRHILKVYYSLNLARMPEGSILKRWSRNAKTLSTTEPQSQQAGNDVSDMVFVHNIVRTTYAMAQQCKDNKVLRRTIHEGIRRLYNEVVRISSRNQTGIQSMDAVTQEAAQMQFRDPPSPTHGWYPRKRRSPTVQQGRRGGNSNGADGTEEVTCTRISRPQKMSQRPPVKNSRTTLARGTRREYADDDNAREMEEIPTQASRMQTKC